MYITVQQIRIFLIRMSEDLRLAVVIQCATTDHTNAGYTPQDNRADFGPISPLPTILGNVPINLVVLKIILSDFPVVWGVIRVTESAQKNVGGAPIANRKYSTPRNKTVKSRIFCPHVCGLSHFEDLIRF